MDRYILLYYALKTIVTLNDKLGNQLNVVNIDNAIARFEMLRIAIKSSNKSRLEILNELDELGLSLFGTVLVPSEIRAIVEEQDKGA